jgi:hypothetical protein
VLAPTTFVEHVINASEWTRVGSRDHRSATAPSPATSSTASRGKFKAGNSSIWIKKSSARPRVGPSGSVGPTPEHVTPRSPRRSGLCRFLGFHWRSQRGSAPVRGDHPAAMAGRPLPGIPGANSRAAGSSLAFGQQRQDSGGSFSGNFNAGPSSGGGGNGASFPPGGT